MEDHSDPRIAIGTMTGTSLDGLDVAAVELHGAGLKSTARLLEHRHVPLGACGSAPRGSGARSFRVWCKA